MNFEELYSFALSRKVLLESYSNFTELVKALETPGSEGAAKYIAEWIATKIGGGSENKVATQIAQRVGATAGSGHSYTKKELFEENKQSVPYINTLCYLFEAAQKFPNIVTSADPVRVDTSTTLDSLSAKWSWLCQHVTLEQTKFVNLINLYATKNTDSIAYLKEAGKEGLIYPALLLRLSEREAPSLSIETLINISPIINAVAHAVAQHFNDTNNPNPTSSYKLQLNAIYDAPQHLTFMFSDTFGKGNATQGMFNGTDVHPLDVKTAKFQLNLAADDPLNKAVISSIHSIAYELMQSTKNIYALFKSTGNAEMQVNQSATADTKKNNQESAIDARYMEQIYVSLSQKGFDAKTLLSLIDGQFKTDEELNTYNLIQRSDPLRTTLEGITIKTLKDLEAAETKLNIDSCSARIKKILTDLSTPVEQASILGLTKDLANSMKAMGSIHI